MRRKHSIFEKNRKRSKPSEPSLASVAIVTTKEPIVTEHIKPPKSSRPSATTVTSNESTPNEHNNSIENEPDIEIETLEMAYAENVSTLGTKIGNIVDIAFQAERDALRNRIVEQDTAFEKQYKNQRIEYQRNWTRPNCS